MSSNLSVRDGKFDVVIAAGPRVVNWPSVGIRALSLVCTEMGLEVAQYGGENVAVRGVIPLPGTGGLVLLEDIQKRIHRIQARAIVRVTPESTLPDPFPGWLSQGLIPIETAEQLFLESEVHWEPLTAILGTGNRALQFGCNLLDSGVPEVYCIESFSQWGTKRFAGWEVNRRRFEMSGGKIIEATPIQLLSLRPLLWQLRLQDSQGVRILETARVVSAGPFRPSSGVREYPSGSLLFELDQTSALTQTQDVEGWGLEEVRGRWLGVKISRALVANLGENREKLDRIYQKAKTKLKRNFRHREVAFTPTFQGKWIAPSDMRSMRAFSGVPRQRHETLPTASVECFEDIPCQICQQVCPTSAIQIGKLGRDQATVLNENACTGCGLCVKACPSSTILLLQEKKEQPLSSIVLPFRGQNPLKEGEFVTLLNRRGDPLGSARVQKILNPEGLPSKGQPGADLLAQIEIPTYLIWEARGIKQGRPTSQNLTDPTLEASERFSRGESKVEITLDGEKRLARDRISISVALFENGQGRPEDVLLCKDGSCGLCQIQVDGVKKLACRTRIHRGMSIRTSSPPYTKPKPEVEQILCPCLDLTLSQLLDRLKEGKLQSAEAILSVTHIGSGKCHGQRCMGTFKRLLTDQGFDVAQWIDWRFPWSDWELIHS